MTRLLLPFTHGVDMEALDMAVYFARNHQATLVPLVLIHVTEPTCSRGVRLDLLQQAQDFLEAVSHKAMKNNVAVERFNVVTHNVTERILHFTSLNEYAGILLFMRDEKGVLLSLHEIKTLLKHGGPSYYLVHLPSKRSKHRISDLVQWFASRFARRPLSSIPADSYYAQESLQLATACKQNEMSMMEQNELF